MTPSELHAYALRFAEFSETSGKGTRWPTLAQCAKHFRVTSVEVEDMADSEEGLGLIVALGIPGRGYAKLPKNRWLVEAYED